MKPPDRVGFPAIPVSYRDLLVDAYSIDTVIADDFPTAIGILTRKWNGALFNLIVTGKKHPEQG
jgi:hypothetical protein